MGTEELRIWAIEKAIQALSGNKPLPWEITRYADALISYVQSGAEPDV